MKPRAIAKLLRILMPAMVVGLSAPMSVQAHGASAGDALQTGANADSAVDLVQMSARLVLGTSPLGLPRPTDQARRAGSPASRLSDLIARRMAPAAQASPASSLISGSASITAGLALGG